MSHDVTFSASTSSPKICIPLYVVNVCLREAISAVLSIVSAHRFLHENAQELSASWVTKQHAGSSHIQQYSDPPAVTEVGALNRDAHRGVEIVNSQLYSTSEHRIRDKRETVTVFH